MSRLGFMEIPCTQDPVYITQAETIRKPVIFIGVEACMQLSDFGVSRYPQLDIAMLQVEFVDTMSIDIIVIT